MTDEIEALDEGWGHVSRHHRGNRESQSGSATELERPQRTYEPSEIVVTDDREPLNLRCSALFLRENTVLLCQRTDGSNTWVLPGGTPKVGEGTAAAAQREVAEETGLNVTADRVAFVLETTSYAEQHHLIEIVFVGTERDRAAKPVQLEPGLSPSFVLLDDLKQIRFRPPMAGYIRGYARYQQGRNDLNESTAAYLGNLWRMSENNV